MPSPLLDPASEKDRDGEYIQQIAEAIHNRAQQGMFGTKEEADRVCELAHTLCRKITMYYKHHGKHDAGKVVMERLTVEGADLLSGIQNSNWNREQRA